MLEAETLVTRAAALWAETCDPQAVNAFWTSTGRPALVDLPAKPPADAERVLAEKLRERIVCQCGALMQRSHRGDQLIDRYACKTCGSGLSVQWHALAKLLF